MSTLSQKHCVPCEGGVEPLKTDEIKKYMPMVPGWELEEVPPQRDPASGERKLVKRFKFKNFKEAINFVNKVADIAEGEGHHPNILVYGWNKVKLTNYTHAINGLHLNDFILAAKINNIEV